MTTRLVEITEIALKINSGIKPKKLDKKSIYYYDLKSVRALGRQEL